jgi:hypothetical protein
MDHLFPIESDRAHVLKWCATLIARPDVRIRYGLLQIQKNQGVGKSTLFEKILAPLIGWHNVSIPSEAEIVDPKFNHWQAHARLAIVHEIYAGETKKAYNRLKSAMTDDKAESHIKMLVPYKIDNYITVGASSNDKRPLYMAVADRRWLIPEVTDKLRPSEYWRTFNAWLVDEGLAIIHQWAIEYVEKHGVVADGEHAPMSEMKRRLIEDSQSEGQKLVRQLVEAGFEQIKKKQFVFTDRDVRGWVMGHRGMDERHQQNLESLATIRETLTESGLVQLRMGKVRGLRTYFFANHSWSPEADPTDPQHLIPF